MEFRNNELKKKMLIVDDVVVNREMLKDVFEGEYEILEANDRLQALSFINADGGVSIVIVDVSKPEMGGLELLKDLNQSGAIKDLPVFLLATNTAEQLLHEGYNLGAVDAIQRPFFPDFLRRRVSNVIMQYNNKNRIESLIHEQMKRIDDINQSMVEALATIIEFRGGGESGAHAKRICELSRVLMKNCSREFPEYYLSDQEVEKVAAAAILHDVGKISTPDHILNKPGRLTREEFEVMKLHTIHGCEILHSLSAMLEGQVYNYAYDICRHHHERWDGSGYPDGLKRDEISIWSQVVSLADVYDALTSKRVYKRAYSHKTAVDMIQSGECGAFNQKLIKVFLDSQDELKDIVDEESVS